MSRRATPDPQGALALVVMGSFSHTNERLLEQLRRRFPGRRIDVLDVARSPVLRGPALAPVLWQSLRRGGVAALRGRDALLRHALKTPAFFRAAGDWARAQLSRGGYACSLQTQSLFDASLAGLPHFVYTDHTHLENLRYPGFDRRHLAPNDWISLEGSIYRHATATLTMSSNVSRSLVEDYRCKPAQVVTVGVGFNATGQEASQPAGPTRAGNVLFVGIDWERKGGPTLLAAFDRLRERLPDATLTIVGCRPDVGARPGCEVVGRVPLADVASFYRRASVFCLPTELEPFGIVFLEAFAAALPVVATGIGAIPDFVVDGETGYLVPPRDAAAVADRLGRLLADPQRAHAMGRLGRERVLGWYSWDAVGARIAAVLRERAGIR